MYDKSMESRTLTSVGEYLATSYQPDFEYVDGQLLERNLGERDHSEVQMAVSAYLHNRRLELGIHVFPEQRVQVSATRFRVPDICVVAGPRPKDLILKEPPLICIEILSKEDRPGDIQRRIDDYLIFGVRYVWVLDPGSRRAQVHTVSGTEEVTEGLLRTENPTIIVPLTEIFAEI